MSAETSARSVRQVDHLDPSHALQRVLYRSAKSDPTRRFHALYGHVARSDILWRAWADVAANRGAPGIDGMSIEAVEAAEGGVRAFLDDIAAALRGRRYRPVPLRRVYIPKADGRMRPLGIPTVRDRVVMAAAKIVLEPIFEADFLPSSFGFRPKRSAHQAIEAIRVEANRGADFVLDADLSDCFGQIDHDALMALVAKRVSDRSMLKLLRSWLRAGVLEGGVLTDATSGTPQGSPISPLLANIALRVLDAAWARAGRRLGVLVRYADDYVVLCPTMARVEEGRSWSAPVLSSPGLQLDPDKTRIACLKRGAKGFDFLGFHHHKVESWRRRDHWYLQRWPSKRAMVSIRAKVRQATDRRFVGYSLEMAVAQLNPILRGWAAYFRVGNSARKFGALDSYVHLRLATLASNKHSLPYRNWARTSPFNVEWLTGLGTYRTSGTVRWATMHASR